MNWHRERSSAFQDNLSDISPSDSNISSIGSQLRRVLVDDFRSSWMNELKGRLDELTGLPPGWDGYAGRPVPFQCAYFAASLLDRICIPGVGTPSLVPGGDGTLQIEWHLNQYDIEIDVQEPYRVFAMRFDHVTGECQEIELETDFSPIAEWIEDLGADRGLVERAEA